VDSNLTDDLTLAEVLTDAFDARERHFGVALPGIVVSYDSGTQTATIQPAVNRLVPDADAPDEDLSEPLPRLQSVPVMWPRGRNFSFTGTLSAGDPVLLVCIDRDMSGWRSTGTQSDPQDARLHDWSSAVAIPGLVPAVASFTPAPTDAAALAALVLVELNKLWRALEAHVHPVSGAVTTPTNAIGAPVAVLGLWSGAVAGANSASSVASTVLKLGA
jgi:hypothetical protein